MPPPRPKPLIVTAVVLLTLAALAVRLAGLDFFLPYLPEPDRYTVWQLEYLWAGGEAMHAPINFWWYPTFAARTLASTPIPEIALSGDLTEHLAAAAAPILRVRMFVALSSVLVIPGTFLLARRFIGDRRALLAAALVTTSLLLFIFSTQARLHAAQASFAVLAVVAALRMRTHPTLPAYLIAGIASALAVGVLQNGVFVLPALCVAFLLRRGERDLRRLLALAALPVLASVLLFYPVLASPGERLESPHLPWGYELGAAASAQAPEVQERRDHSGDYTGFTVRDGNIELGPQRLDLKRFNGKGFAVMEEELRWNDPVLYGLGALGLLLVIARLARSRDALRKNFGDVLTVAAYFVPMLLVMGLYEATKGRFMLPLLPYLAIFAAVAGGWLIGLLAKAGRSPGARTALSAAGFLVLLALPLFTTGRRAWLQHAPDTVELAAQWVAENIDPENDRIMVSSGLALPAFYDAESLEGNLAEYSGAKSYWLCYQDLLPAELHEGGLQVSMIPLNRKLRGYIEKDPRRASELLRNSPADYFVVEVSQRVRAMRYQVAILSALQRDAELVAAFYTSDQQAQDHSFLDFQDCPQMAWRTLNAKAIGPPIEIYRLRR